MRIKKQTNKQTKNKLVYWIKLRQWVDQGEYVMRWDDQITEISISPKHIFFSSGNKEGFKEENDV